MPSNSTHPAELVEQMPDTDQERQPKEGQPHPSRAPTSKFTGPDPAQARQIYEQLLSGGEERLAELLKLVRMPGDAEYKNDKPIYVVHGLAMYVGQPDRKTQRALLTRALAAALQNGACPKSAKAFFIRQLQLVGDAAVVPAVAAHLLDEELCEDAAQALAAIEDESKKALNQALPRAEGKARRSILHALGKPDESNPVPNRP